MATSEKSHVIYDQEGGHGTVGEHFLALRKTLIAVFCTIVLGAVLSLLFYSSLIEWALKPLNQLPKQIEINEVKRHQIHNHGHQPFSYTLPASNSIIREKSEGVIEIAPISYLIPPGGSIVFESMEHNSSLALLGPLEGMKTTLKLCFWIGFIGTSPLWICWILKFIFPAFEHNQRHFLIPFTVLSFFFLGVGFYFGHQITLPFVNHMLTTFNTEIGINLWSYSSYVDYTLLLLLANGLVFELALLLFFLVHIGVLTAEFMISHRKGMMVAAFIVAALLTPPDVFTQLLLAIPLIGLYELAIVYSKMRTVH